MDKKLSAIKTRHRVSALTAALIVAGCSTTSGPPEWTSWQDRRIESIGGPNGWTTLVGLHWLQDGDNTAGNATTNQIVLRSDHLPAFIGVFNRQSNSVSFTAVSNADVRVDGHPVAKTELLTDDSPNPTRLQVGSVSILAIHRGDRIGLRVRDPDSDARRHFKGLRWYPYDPSWRLVARLESFPEERKLHVPDVTGNIQEMDSPGAIVFTVDGSEHRLDAVQEKGESELFIMFHDETAGDSTYTAGRFLYVQKPDSIGRTVIDFNRAFTPPCGFTAYATCPIPPKQNWLPLPVRAGELKPEGGGH